MFTINYVQFYHRFYESKNIYYLLNNYSCKIPYYYKVELKTEVYNILFFVYLRHNLILI